MGLARRWSRVSTRSAAPCWPPLASRAITRTSSSAEAVAAAIGDSPALVVLDNSEHLVAGCADLVASLLAANLSVSMLTTSREPLGVPGEVSWRVPSMGDARVTFHDRAERAAAHLA